MANQNKSVTGKGSNARLDIRTVAKAAGVSIATVSRVVNKMPTVAPHLQVKVAEAIRKLGYVTNTQARALVSGRSKMFGVIISDITNPFFPELIQGFEEEAIEVGYETLIGSTNYDLSRMELCVQRMLERKVDGVAIMTFGIEEPLLDRLSSQGIPMVFVDMAPRKKNIATIHVDYEKGISEAVAHLCELGHRRISFISGPLRLHSAAARLKAFKSAARARGCFLDRYVVYGDHTMVGGERGMEQLLRLKNAPTAVICSNDITAIGAMHSASRAGLSIPEDISLIGFDNVQITEYMLPPLTTITMSGRDIASRAVSALLSPGVPLRTVETTLVVRQTTSGPRLRSLSARRTSRTR